MITWQMLEKLQENMKKHATENFPDLNNVQPVLLLWKMERRMHRVDLRDIPFEICECILCATLHRVRFFECCAR